MFLCLLFHHYNTRVKIISSSSLFLSSYNSSIFLKNATAIITRGLHNAIFLIYINIYIYIYIIIYINTIFLKNATAIITRGLHL